MKIRLLSQKKTKEKLAIAREKCPGSKYEGHLKNHLLLLQEKNK